MSLLKLDHIKSKYSLEVTHIAHVGAHKGEEVDDYKKNFKDVKISLFEPQVDLFGYLQTNFGSDSDISLYNFALGSSTGFSTMFIADNEGESSSFYKPKHHLIEHPEIKFKEEDTTFEIKVLDDLEIASIDLLNIDTQGFELEVLKGAVNTLSHDAKYIILEINKKELYEGCPHVRDIDSFLKNYGFIRTDTHYWEDSYSWGDAFYIKKELVSFNRYLFSSFKNFLYSSKILYNPIIKTRNIFWRFRNKHS